MKLDEHIALVELSAQKRLEAQLAEIPFSLRAFGERIFKGRLSGLALFHRRQLKHYLGIFNSFHEAIVRDYIRPFRIRLSDNFASLILIVPKIGSGLHRFKLCKLLAALCNLNIFGHFAHADFQIRHFLPDFFSLEQSFLFLFRHDNCVLYQKG